MKATIQRVQNKIDDIIEELSRYYTISREAADVSSYENEISGLYSELIALEREQNRNYK